MLRKILSVAVTFVGIIGVLWQLVKMLELGICETVFYKPIVLYLWFYILIVFGVKIITVR